MPSEAIVQVLFVAVDAGVADALQGAAVLAVVQRLLHVGLVVEVGHLPAVVVVVVVVGVGGVVGGRDALGVGRRGAVVEVGLRAGRRREVGGDGVHRHLLRHRARRGADTDHPDEQHHEDDEDDGGADAVGDVDELGLALAALAVEVGRALAARLVRLHVHLAAAAVDAEVVADVDAHRLARVVLVEDLAVARLALALVVLRLLVEDAEGVRLAELDAAVHQARVGALLLGHGADVVGGRVRRTRLT